MTIKEKSEAKNHLLTLLKNDDTLYTNLMSVSKSGMSRKLKVFFIKDNNHLFLNYHIAKTLDYKLHDDGSIKVTGCGMDMGFHLIDVLSRSLGIKLKQRWI